MAGAALGLLAGCAGGPAPPDWEIEAHGALDAYARHALEGRARLAERDFARARAALARTGRADLLARAELTRCALQVASLVFEPCAGFEALRVETAMRWDADALAADVGRSQRERLAVFDALRHGAGRPWDHQPRVDASTQYTRNTVGGVEERDRLSRYPPFPSPGP